MDATIPFHHFGIIYLLLLWIDFIFSYNLKSIQPNYGQSLVTSANVEHRVSFQKFTYKKLSETYCCHVTNMKAQLIPRWEDSKSRKTLNWHELWRHKLNNYVGFITFLILQANLNKISIPLEIIKKPRWFSDVSRGIRS